MHCQDPKGTTPGEHSSRKEERRRGTSNASSRTDRKSYHPPHGLKRSDEDEISSRAQSGAESAEELLRAHHYVKLEDDSFGLSAPTSKRTERNPFMRSLQSSGTHDRSKGHLQHGTSHRVASAVRDLLSTNNSDPRAKGDSRRRPDTPGVSRSLEGSDKHVRFISHPGMTYLAPINEEALVHRPSDMEYTKSFPRVPQQESSSMYHQMLSEMKGLSVRESTLFRKRSTNIFESVYVPVNTCQPSAQGGGDRNSGYVAPSTTPTNQSVNENQLRKREREGDKYPDDDDDESDDEDRRRNKKGKGPDGRSPHLGLRCPFYLRDPDKFSRIQACSNGKGFADMARLRHHLKRDHTQPLRCPRCQKEMKSLLNLQEHLRDPFPCENRSPPVDDRLNAVQWEKISSRRGSMRMLHSVEEKWRALYLDIFPDDARIPSPYDKSILLSQIECILREVLEESLHAGPMDRYQIPVIIQNCKSRLEQPRQQSGISSPTAPTEVHNNHEHPVFATPTRRAPPPTRPATAMANYSPQSFSPKDSDKFGNAPNSQVDPRTSFNGISMVEMQQSKNPFRAPTPRIIHHSAQSPWTPMSNPSSSLLPSVRPASANQHRLDEITRPWSPLNSDWLGFNLEHDGVDK